MLLVIHDAAVATQTFDPCRFRRSTRSRSLVLGNLPPTIAEIPPERRSIQKLATFPRFVPTSALVSTRKHHSRVVEQYEITERCESRSEWNEFAWSSCLALIHQAKPLAAVGNLI
jgi:hypothetical protein